MVGAQSMKHDNRCFKNPHKKNQIRNEATRDRVSNLFCTSVRFFEAEYEKTRLRHLNAKQQQQQQSFKTDVSGPDFETVEPQQV